MARKRRPSLKSKSKSEPGPFAKGVMISVSICIVAFIGAIVVYGNNFIDKVKVDKETGCLSDGPKTRMVMIVDQTDTFTPVQAADIQNQFKAYKGKVPRYGELVVYAIRPVSSGMPTPIIRACNPGSAEDINQLVESSVQIKRKWRKSFDAPMRRVFEEVLQPRSSNISPIIETIQAIVVKEFGPTWMDNRGKELIVISDLLQHSAVLSHYRGRYNVDKFIQSQNFNKLSADLRDVNVDLLYLYRDTQNAKQNSVHRNFWIRLIQKQGGSVRRIYSVSG